MSAPRPPAAEFERTSGKASARSPGPGDSHEEGVREARHRDRDALIAEGRRVLEVEARGVTALAPRLGDDFVGACELVADARGRIIVSGIGKSGIVARKIAATLTSTGTPANFIHPIEGLHGDLGIVGRNDVALLVSRSGETSELTGLVDYLLRLGVPIVTITGGQGSSLARVARFALDASVAEEACPMDLAPTASTAAGWPSGDAMARRRAPTQGFQRGRLRPLTPWRRARSQADAQGDRRDDFRRLSVARRGGQDARERRADCRDEGPRSPSSTERDASWAS